MARKRQASPTSSDDERQSSTKKTRRVAKESKGTDENPDRKQSGPETPTPAGHGSLVTTYPTPTRSQWPPIYADGRPFYEHAGPGKRIHFSDDEESDADPVPTAKSTPKDAKQTRSPWPPRYADGRPFHEHAGPGKRIHFSEDEESDANPVPRSKFTLEEAKSVGFDFDKLVALKNKQRRTENDAKAKSGAAKKGRKKSKPQESQGGGENSEEEVYMPPTVVGGSKRKQYQQQEEDGMVSPSTPVSAAPTHKSKKRVERTDEEVSITYTNADGAKTNQKDVDATEGVEEQPPKPGKGDTEPKAVVEKQEYVDESTDSEL